MTQPVFTCIAPHGWLIVPLVSGSDGNKTHATRTALTEMGQRLDAARPETILIVDPHGLQIEGTIALLDTDNVHGETGGPPNLGATAHTFSMNFAVDRELNAAIATMARHSGLPVSRVRNFFDFVPLGMDYGSMNPLWYLGSTMMPPPKLTVVCMGPGIARSAYLDFGRVLHAVLNDTARRVAFIASADMAHRHSPDGPYGYDVAAPECDAKIIEAAKTNTLGRLLDYESGWLDRAFTDAIEPLLILHGLTEGEELRAEVLSYEVPTYFGMLCAVFGA